MGFFDFLKKKMAVSLSDETLNKAVSSMLDKDGEIQSLCIAMHDGYCQVDARIKHNLAEFDVTVEFEIKLELNKESQIIELRKKKSLVIVKEGLRNKIVVAVVRAFVSAFLGKSLLHWSLKDTDDVTSSGDTVSVDLAKVKDALYAAMAEKMGSVAPWLSALIQGGTGKLADHVAISSVECKKGELVVNIELNAGPAL